MVLKTWILFYSLCNTQVEVVHKKNTILFRYFGHIKQNCIVNGVPTPYVYKNICWGANALDFKTDEVKSV